MILRKPLPGVAVAGLPNFPLPTTRTLPSLVGTSFQSVSRARVLSPTLNDSEERRVREDSPSVSNTRIFLWLVCPMFVPS